MHSPSIHNTCRPRPDVLRGGLVDKHFAAQLDQVVRAASGYETYADAESFFDLTFPTRGLKELLSGTFARLSGQPEKTRNAEHAVYRYETSFGGGKTHGLIALWHLAAGARPDRLEEFIDPTLLPQRCRVAAVVGDSLDPLNGLTTDGVTTYTLWGELGRQLGGRAGPLLARSDAARTSCSKQVWLDLLSEAPTVIVIDELATYLRRLATSDDEKVRRLAGATVDSLKVLFEAASAAPAVRVIVTLATGTTAFGAETDELQQVIDEVDSQRLVREASDVMERLKGAMGRPADDDEIGYILRRRIFQHVDDTAAVAAADAYQSHYAELADRGVRAGEATEDPAAYAERLRRSYPFHPALIDCLDKRIGPLPGFQRARGALKMLAESVACLWSSPAGGAAPGTAEQGGAAAVGLPVINLGDLPLENEQVRAAVTSSIDREELHGPAVADFAGPGAHAAVVDNRRWPRERIATRACRTVFLHSVGPEPSPGAARPDIYAGTLRPGEDPSLVDEAMGSVLEVAWHLVSDGARWRFTVTPNANRIIAAETANVTESDLSEELDRRIRLIFPSDGEINAVHAVSEPVHVSDEPRLQLAVFHHVDLTVGTNAFGGGGSANPGERHLNAPPQVVAVAELAGATEAARTYRNAVVALAADNSEVERMRDRLRFELAARRITEDTPRLSGFDPQVAASLKNLTNSAQLETRIAICRAYRHLYWPEKGPGRGYLRHFELPPVQQGQATKTQTRAILETLREYAKIAAKAPATDRLASASGFNRSGEVTTKALAEVTWRDFNQQIVLDPALLVQAIATGVTNRSWVYYDAERERAWDSGGAAPPVRVAADTWLYSPQRATQLELLRKPVTAALVTEALAITDDNKTTGTELRSRLETAVGGEPTKKEVLEVLAAVTGTADGPVVLNGPAVSGAKPLSSAGVRRSRLDALSVISAAAAVELNITVTEPTERTVRGQGSVGKAFQQITDRIADSGSPAVTGLSVTAIVDPGEGVDDLRRLGFCIPQLPRWSCEVKAEITVEYTGLTGGVKATLTGTASDYQTVENKLLDLAGAGCDVTGRLRLALTPPNVLRCRDDQWQQLRTVVAANQPGRVTIEAELAAPEPAQSQSQGVEIEVDR